MAGAGAGASAGATRHKIVPMQFAVATAATVGAPLLSSAHNMPSQPVTPNPKSRRAAAMGSLDALSSPPFGGSAFSPSASAASASAKTPGRSASQWAAVHGPSPQAAKFADRINRAKTEESFGASAKMASVPAASQVRCELSLVPGQQTLGYRYMYEKLTEKGELLDAQIEHFAPILAKLYVDQHVSKNPKAAGAALKPDDDKDALDPSGELADPMVHICNPVQPRHDQSLYVGRICCDSLIDGVRLNEQSVVLEASRRMGNGARVKLNLEAVAASGKGLLLFPGQIVGLVATNPSGRLLNVSSILYPPLPPRPVGIVVASGPYTLDDSLQYEPLESLVTDVIERDPPDVVILLGPFADEDVDDIFRNQISARLDRMRAARPGLQIILVPSTRDACTEWIAFPQPPLAAALDLGLLEPSGRVGGGPGGSAFKSAVVKEGINLFPNPVQFRINEMVFAVSTTDILFDLSTVECARQATVAAGAPATDRLDRMARSFQQILQQRSFYPVFPPSPGACLDATRALAMTTVVDGQEAAGPLVLQVVPDVLIVPSKLRHAIRAVDGSLCINPGVLTKGRSGGTYTRMCVYPLRTDGAMADMHFVTQRTAVETRRI
ncbi:DNA polymerase alpha/epsilon subunit B-domain-containing protein [Entophlyctis helioformis]|nr:DNA polymerase alpha/epsilon subunit B-domain-containing protein [Entophlyctis helioformis]